MDYLGGLGQATGVRGGIPGHGLLAPDSGADPDTFYAGKGSEMAQGCYSLSGSYPKLVKPLSWHSFRVFIPDCAFQMGIPRERRMYLGNWLTESTADVYVREKRNVVVEIWGQIAQKVPNLNLGPGRERREDLNHPDWADPHQ